MVGAAIPGAMFSKGVAEFVPGGKYGKLAVAVIAAVGAASITGSTTGADVARGALAGAAIQQGSEAISEIAQPLVSGFVSGGEPSKLKEFVSKATGLSSPDSFYTPAPLEPAALGNAFVQRSITPPGV